MAVLKILVAPDPRLKVVAEPVLQVTDAIRQTLNDMLDTMYAAPGIGLAATQVGINKRLVVIDVANTEAGEAPRPLKFINPEVVACSNTMNSYPEGCLSVPGFYEDVERPESCTVRYLDENGTPQQLQATGLLATCIQHEIDHLNGVLFVDHLSRMKKSMIVKKLDKAKKQQRLSVSYPVVD